MKCPCLTYQCPCLQSFISHTDVNILMDLEAKKEGLDLEKSSMRRLDVGQLIASQPGNAQVSLIQRDVLEKCKDLGIDQNSKAALDQDAMAYASMTIASGRPPPPPRAPNLPKSTTNATATGSEDCKGVARRFQLNMDMVQATRCGARRSH
jgi:hypothetical protein